MKTIGILVFDEVEELDFVGPLEVFGMAARFGADCETLVIAPQPGHVRCRHGLQVLPDCSLQEAPALDLLIVPGGLGARTHARENPQILEFVRRQRGTVVLSARAHSSLRLQVCSMGSQPPRTTPH